MMGIIYTIDTRSSSKCTFSERAWPYKQAPPSWTAGVLKLDQWSLAVTNTAPGGMLHKRALRKGTNPPSREADAEDSIIVSVNFGREARARRGHAGFLFFSEEQQQGISHDAGCTLAGARDFFFVVAGECSVLQSGAIALWGRQTWWL